MFKNSKNYKNIHQHSEFNQIFLTTKIYSNTIFKNLLRSFSKGVSTVNDKTVLEFKIC